MLVEDHAVIRDGISLLIKGSGRYYVCAATGDAGEAVRLAAQFKPEIVLLDLLLGGRDALDTIREIIQAHPATRVLIFSMLNEAVYAERALKAGAAGYLMKSASREEFQLALENVRQGKTYLSPKVFVRIFRDARLSDSGFPQLHDLSDRELQLFQMIGAGLPNREIARLLEISVKTVESHRENIKNKLALSDSNELMAASARFVEAVRS